MLLMKKISFTLWSTFLLLGTLSAQNTPVEEYRPTQAKKYQTLNNEINTICFFVHTSRDAWNDREMDAYLAMLDSSQVWLQQQAARFGQEISFRKDRFLRNYEPVYLRSVYAGDSHWVMNKIAKQLNFQDFDAFLEWYKFDLAQEKLKIILFVKDNSRSHAYDYFSHEEVDIAVVYDRNFGVPSDKYVIAHELLHLFGAWDLYYGTSQSREKAERAKALYPHSVMINTHVDKDSLEVDELTAWRVGWHDNFQETFMDFSPVRMDRSREGVDEVRWKYTFGEAGKAERRARAALRKSLRAAERESLPPVDPWLIGLERYFGISFPGNDDYGTKYVSSGVLFGDLRLARWLYLGAGVGNYKHGFTSERVLNGVTLPTPDGNNGFNQVYHKGPIPTRRDVTLTYRVLPIRLTLVLWQKDSYELTFYNSYVLMNYHGDQEKTRYWYGASEEVKTNDSSRFFAAEEYDNNRHGFVHGFSLHKNLFRRVQVRLNAQVTSRKVGGKDYGSEPVAFKFKTFSLGLGAYYNIRGGRYLHTNSGS